MAAATNRKKPRDLNLCWRIYTTDFFSVFEFLARDPEVQV
jgi:hypothetical protein